LSIWENDAGKTSWPISRVIWRAGELQIRESLPLIAKKVDKSLGSMEQYAVGWAISRIALVASAEEKEQALAILKELGSLAETPAVSRISRLEEEYLSDYLKSKAFYQRDDAVTDVEILYTMSLLDGAVQENLVSFAREVDIAEGSFRLIRLLYKLSEARQDGTLYGELVNRLEYESTRLQMEMWRVTLRWRLVC